MIQFIKNLIFEIKLLWSFSSLQEPLLLVHITEKFDVVERVPDYNRIKM